MNKDNYLKDYATDERKNSSIIDQIEDSVVSVLKEGVLGYHGGAEGGKEKAQVALRNSIYLISGQLGCSG